jgi:hypothetical protein
LYQIDPLIILTTTQTTTASQLIDPKSISASNFKVDQRPLIC